MRPARACMTQHDLAQAPTQAQLKPRLGGARVRSWARVRGSSFAPFLFFPLPRSLSPPLRRAHSQARPGLPSAVGLPVRAPTAGGRARAHTHSAPEAMARASPSRRLWRTAGNGSEGWQATDWAGTRLSRRGGEWRRQTRKPPSCFLPAALGRWTSGRAALAPDPRGGSGSDDSNDGCRRFAKTERRRAESSEGEVLSPQPIRVCCGDSRPPLRASPQQPADRSQSGNSFVAWLPPQGRNTPSNATSIGRNDTLPRRIGISDQSTKRIGPDRLAKGEPLSMGGRLSHLAPVHWLLSLPY